MFFEERGISAEVRDARPYIPWTLEDISLVREAYRNLSPGQRAFMTKIANQGPGFVIVRHAVPGFPRVYAEIRPYEKVQTGPPTCQWHGEGEPPEEACKLGVRILRRDTVAFERHCDKVNKGGHGEYDHRGEERVHEHLDLAKYVFSPSPKVVKPWTHDHSGYKEHPEGLASHLEKWHEGKKKDQIQWNKDGMHTHPRKVKDPSQSLARRIDIHPMALDLFGNARRVFFVIEGCLKADAVLSAGEAVFSVPSVTLWDAPELPYFCERFLRGKMVVTVPDADWFQNSAVIAQARFCQSYMWSQSITACVAAPPQEAGQKGVDDFLGKGGGRLDDLDVIEKVPPEGLVEYIASYGGRKDKITRNTEVLRALVVHADPNGQLRASQRTIAKIMGTGQKRVSRALKDLQEDYGAITIDGSLETKRNWFSGKNEWVESPLITIAPELRGKRIHTRLGDFTTWE